MKDEIFSEGAIVKGNWFFKKEPMREPFSSPMYVPTGFDARPGNTEDEIVMDFLTAIDQLQYPCARDFEGYLRLALRRAADAAVRTTLDAEKPAAGVVYETAEERAAKKPQQSLDLNEILVAINKFSFHLVKFFAKVALYSLQQDLKDAASVLEDAANDLQDAIGESGVLDPEQEVAQP